MRISFAIESGQLDQRLLFESEEAEGQAAGGCEVTPYT